MKCQADCEREAVAAIKCSFTDGTLISFCREHLMRVLERGVDKVIQNGDSLLAHVVPVEPTARELAERN